MKLEVVIDNESYEALKEKCSRYDLSIAEYIRFLLGDKHQPAIFELVNKSKRFLLGEKFTLDDLLMEPVSRGVRATLSRNFNKRIEATDIMKIETDKGPTQYIRIGEGEKQIIDG